MIISGNKLTLFGGMWSLYALMFPLSTQMHFRPHFGGFYFHPCLLVIFLALAALVPLKNAISARNVNVVLFGAFAYLLTMMLSAYISGLTNGNQFGYKYILKYLFFFFCVLIIAGTVRKASDIRPILLSFIIAIVTIALYGFYISITGRTDYPTNPFKQVGVKNAFGIWIAGYFILHLYFINSSKHIVSKVLLVLGLLVVLFVQVFTLSRSGWFIICLNFFFFVIGMKKRVTWIYTICFVYLALNLALKYIPQSYIKQAEARYESISTAKNISNTSKGRMVYVYKTFILFMEYPLFGIGPNNFQRYDIYIPIIDRLDTNVSHNIYLNVIVETGLVGILTFFFLCSRIFSHFLSARKCVKSKDDKDLFNCLWLSVALYMIMGLFTEEVIFIPSFGLILGVAIGYSGTFLDSKKKQRIALGLQYPSNGIRIDEASAG